MDSKPTCSNPPADPEMVYPNVYFRNLLVRLPSRVAIGVKADG